MSLMPRIAHVVRLSYNLHSHRLWSEKQNKFIKLTLSNKGLRIVNKLGLDAALAKYGVESLREKIKLVSSAGTGHFYTTTKNKKTMPDKMEIKKFDPVVRKYVTYTEKKIK